MKLTKSSKNIIKILIATLTTVMDELNTMPIVAMMKMIQVSANAIACPAIILAKRRTIKAKGFVKIPKISITGINGTGTFNHAGTSGQKISLQ